MAQSPHDFDREFADIVGKLDIRTPRWPQARPWLLSAVVLAATLAAMLLAVQLPFPVQLLVCAVAFLVGVLLLARVRPGAPAMQLRRTATTALGGLGSRIGFERGSRDQ